MLWLFLEEKFPVAITHSRGVVSIYEPIFSWTIINGIRTSVNHENEEAAIEYFQILIITTLQFIMSCYFSPEVLQQSIKHHSILFPILPPFHSSNYHHACSNLFATVLPDSSFNKNHIQQMSFSYLKSTDVRRKRSL